jgi:branched-chain amino acid transport system substrate-binding protein
MHTLSRRKFLKLAAGSAALVAASGTLVSCAAPGGGGAASAIKIGYVSPQTGPLAGFGEADSFILGEVGAAMEQKLGGRKVEILVKDSQSDPNRAADMAADLILQDGVNLMVVASTPETTNPVSDQCEANGVPCISTVAPWQPWFFRSQQVPEAGYQWTYHFFWGLEDIIGVFTAMWNEMGTNKVVGGMWPSDGDGLAWSDGERGFPPVLAEQGFNVIDPGRYQNLTDDFSAQIAAFKDGGAEIITGVMIPPDLKTFMTQASQQGFTPPMVTVGKAALFPSAVEAIGGTLGNGITTEIWWTPSHPFKSSLTAASAADLAGAYEQSVKKQWTQPIGFVHALFEVAADALARATNAEDKAALRDAIKATKLDTIVGTLDWSAGPTPNVAKTPLVGGQWVAGQQYPFELVITSNAAATNIPTGGSLQPMSWAG